MDHETPAQQALRNASRMGAGLHAIKEPRSENRPAGQLEQNLENIGPDVPDTIGVIADEANRDELRAICGILNAFTLMKQNVAGTPYWTEQDLRRFSLAVKAMQQIKLPPVQKLRRA